MSREMKDSGVEGIGQIPSNWQISNIKNVSSIYGRIGFRGYTVDDLVEGGKGAITLSPTNIVNGQLKLDKCSYISWEKYEESPEIKIDVDDIVFVKTASVGKVCIIEKLSSPMTVNPQFVVLKKIKINSKFLYYVLYSTVIQSQLSLDLSGGVLKTITQRNLGVYKIPLCNQSEQQNIVRVLEFKINYVDDIIKKTKSTIEDYKLLKQSIITEAVTKGLDKNVEMKDSGNEWIGKIPQNWIITKLKKEVYLRARLGWKGLKADEYVDDGIIFLATPNIKEFEIDFTNVNYISRERYEESPEIKVSAGDVLLTKDGSTLGTLNVVRYLPNEVTINGSIALLTPSKKLHSLYLYYYIKSSYIQNIIMLKKGGMGVPHLFQRDIKEFSILLPSVKEQTEISEYLDSKCRELDALMLKKEILMTNLEQYKTSIIYEYVTGKKELK